MVTLIIYDIADNKLRKQVEEIILDEGLHRIQYSAFRAQTRTSHRLSLVKELKMLASTVESSETFSIHVYFIGAPEFDKHVEIGSGYRPCHDGGDSEIVFV